MEDNALITGHVIYNSQYNILTDESSWGPSKISKKIWRAKVKPFLTPHLSYKVMPNI